MSKQAYERKLKEIEDLRTAAPDLALPALRRALRDRSNYLVAKAAAVAGDRRFGDLIPDLVDAFARMMKDPIAADKQCWAKTAIAKALKDLEHDEPEVFLQGIVHRQLEPVWGGVEDTAVALRGTCAMALVGCKSVGHLDVLRYLTDLLADFETPARIDAARAIASMGAREGMLPLRLKARLGDREPEVTGHCFAALLSLTPSESLEFVAKFLKSDDADVRMEAAAALADSRESAALELLREFLSRQTDPEVHRTVLTILGTSPQLAAAEYLLSVAESAPERVAGYAVAALGAGRHASALRASAQRLVSNRESQMLTAAFEKAFGTGSADSSR